MQIRKALLSLGSIAMLSTSGAIVATSTSCGKKHEQNLMQVNVTKDVAITYKDPEVSKEDEYANIQYSIDSTENWQTFSLNTRISFKAGQTVYFKGNNPTGLTISKDGTETNLVHNPRLIISNGAATISGNIMALINNGSGDNIDTIPNDYCFANLFSDDKYIVDISMNFLPAINLTPYCYEYMFKGTEIEGEDSFYSPSLLTLPATTLAEGCYMGMFSHCRLRVAPDLPAETLMPNCYNSMFKGCEYLDYIKIYYKGNFDTTSETSSTYNWVKGVQNSAYWSQHFYYRGTDRTTGPSAIPGGQWDIISNW